MNDKKSARIIREWIERTYPGAATDPKAELDKQVRSTLEALQEPDPNRQADGVAAFHQTLPREGQQSVLRRLVTRAMSNRVRQREPALTALRDLGTRATDHVCSAFTLSEDSTTRLRLIDLLRKLDPMRNTTVAQALPERSQEEQSPAYQEAKRRAWEKILADCSQRGFPRAEGDTSP